MNKCIICGNLYTNNLEDNGKCVICEINELKDLLNERDEKIKELEKYKSKYLDCLDKQIERENATHDFLLRSRTILDNLKQENQQLKLDLGMFKSVNEFINNYGLEKAREVLMQSEKSKIQSQNSKAIEVLEEIKEFVHKENKYFVFIYRSDINKEIDRKIAELRGKRE